MSVIYQKADFYNAAIAHLQSGGFPVLAARVAAGDVTVTQQIGAMAQMAAMLSYQIGLAEVEPWLKARENMVLADAAARGIIPYGKSAVYTASVRNRGDTALTLNTGRRLLDNKGRIWTVVKGAGIAAKAQGSVLIEQYEERQTVHTVAERKSFYRIPVPKDGGGAYLCSIAVRHSDGTWFAEKSRFTNTEADERVYHVYSDEYADIGVMFGLEGRAGYIPQTGEEITLVCRYCEGDVVLPPNTPLEPEYAAAGENALEILSGSREYAGSQPQTIAQLREITDYPSLYDENAVFLGEFAFLLQRRLAPFDFLNVWNERIEETARRADTANINTLFVSFKKGGIAKQEAQKQIREVIAGADNSYQVRFIEPVEVKIKATVNLALAAMHDDAAIRQRVSAYLLARYGANSAWAKKGGGRINIQDTVKGIRETVGAFQDGISDITMSVSQTGKVLPEQFRFITEDAVSFNIEKL